MAPSKLHSTRTLHVYRGKCPPPPCPCLSGLYTCVHIYDDVKNNQKCAFNNYRLRSRRNKYRYTRPPSVSDHVHLQNLPCLRKYKCKQTSEAGRLLSRAGMCRFAKRESRRIIRSLRVTLKDKFQLPV